LFLKTLLQGIDTNYTKKYGGKRQIKPLSGELSEFTYALIDSPTVPKLRNNLLLPTKQINLFWLLIHCEQPQTLLPVRNWPLPAAADAAPHPTYAMRRHPARVICMSSAVFVCGVH
jgi:hypothetical protein